MSDVKIDRAVPQPPRKRYPIAKLEVGESFFVAVDTDENPRALVNQQAALGTCARQVVRRHEGRKFTTRRVVEGGKRGIRLWRVE